jgi:hypothetical protein
VREDDLSWIVPGAHWRWWTRLAIVLIPVLGLGVTGLLLVAITTP